MSATTRPLNPQVSTPPPIATQAPYSPPRRSIQKMGPRGALIIIVLLAIVVIITAMLAATINEDAASRMGVWTPLISTAQARRSIEVVQTPKGGKYYTYRLKERATYMNKAIKQKTNRNYIRTHIQRFNQAVANKKYVFQKYGVINAQSDNIFQLRYGGRKDRLPTLYVRNLSPFSRAPATAKEYKRLGNIYLKPPPHKIYSLIGSHLNLFLEPDSETQAWVRTDDYGKQVRAGQIVVTDGANRALALLRVNPHRQTVFVQNQDKANLYVNNNAATDQVDLEDGQTIEMGGLVLEARIEKALPLVETAHSGKYPHRRYPLGNLVHIVGPIALDGAFQSLGIEYMFQEYLMGFAPAGVKPGKIWLTIDLRLQSELMRQISELAAKSKVGKASALIMNADTGAILAMAGEPAGYNPADTAKVVGLLKKRRAHTQNHGCFKRHPIGSVTKPFIALMGLNLIPELNKMRVDGPRTAEDRKAKWKIFGHDMYSAQAIRKKKKAHFDYLFDAR